MKKSLLLMAMGTVFVGSVFAQAAAPSAPAAPATVPSAITKAPTPVTAPAAATAAVNAICKDGTPFSGDSLKGACRGHGGVDKKAAAPASGKAATQAGIAPMAQAAGGADKVWANDSSKVYHCPGDKYYGKTKHGEYLTEADAKTKGFHGEHGKTCASK